MSTWPPAPSYATVMGYRSGCVNTERKLAKFDRHADNAKSRSTDETKVLIQVQQHKTAISPTSIL